MLKPWSASSSPTNTSRLSREAWSFRSNSNSNKDFLCIFEFFTACCIAVLLPILQCVRTGEKEWRSTTHACKNSQKTRCTTLWYICHSFQPLPLITQRGFFLLLPRARKELSGQLQRSYDEARLGTASAFADWKAPGHLNSLAARTNTARRCYELLCSFLGAHITLPTKAKMIHYLQYKLGKHLPQPPALPKTSQMPSGEVLTELARKTRLFWGTKSTCILLNHLLARFPISKPCGDAVSDQNMIFNCQRIWLDSSTARAWWDWSQLGELAGARRLLAAGNRVKLEL